MGKGQGEPRSFLRLLFWEGAALLGFLHLHLHPMAKDRFEWLFFYNGLFFLVAYPLLFVYRWKFTDGCLSTILWPVSFVLGWALGASAYLWTAYALLFTGNPFGLTLMGHWVVLGFLFLFIYLPLLQPLLGTSRNYATLGQLAWILFYSTLGCLLGFLLGQFVDHKFGASIGMDSRRFLLWLALTLVGAAVGALAGQKGSKK